MEDKIKQLIEQYNKGGFTQSELEWELLNLYAVSGRSEQLVKFLLHLNDKNLINNHDFDYEKEAKKYLKKIN